MKGIEKARITPWQFAFAVACFVQSSSLLSAFFASITEHDSWIAVLIAMAVGMPLLGVYLALLRRFPGQNLMQINEAVFGRAGGGVLSALYLWFFFTLASLNLRDAGTFVNKTIMSQTPPMLLNIMLILICAWAVYFGLNVVARYSILFSLISVLVLVVSVIFTFNLVHADNFLPLLEAGPRNMVHASHVVLTIPFGETLVFLMIAPQVRIKNGKIGRYLLGGFLAGGVFMALVLARDTAVLGSAMGFFALPSFETLRMVTLSDALSRMEILFALILILLMFFKISMLFYVSMLTLGEILHASTYRPLVLPWAVLTVIYSMTAYSSSETHTRSGQEQVPFLWLLFEVLLPGLTLAVSYLWKKKGDLPAPAAGAGAGAGEEHGEKAVEPS